MENLMGFRMKVIERTGTRLKDLFSPNTDLEKAASGACSACGHFVGNGRENPLIREGYKEKKNWDIRA